MMDLRRSVCEINFFLVWIKSVLFLAITVVSGPCEVETSRCIRTERAQKKRKIWVSCISSSYAERRKSHEDYREVDVFWEVWNVINCANGASKQPFPSENQERLCNIEGRSVTNMEFKTGAF